MYLTANIYTKNALVKSRWDFSRITIDGSCKYNLGPKVGGKFTKLSKIGFSMGYFTADFLQFFTKKHQNFAFGWTAGYLPSGPSISGIFFKFPNFLRS